MLISNFEKFYQMEKDQLNKENCDYSEIKNESLISKFEENEINNKIVLKKTN